MGKKKQEKITTITEFARERGVSPETVGAYLHRKYNKYQYDRTRGLSAEALEWLDQKYPVKNPVVIVDHETIEALQAKIIKLQDEQKALLVEKSELEKKVGRLELLEDTAQRQAEEVRDLQKELVSKDATIRLRDEEITRMKQRSLIERILNK